MRKPYFKEIVVDVCRKTKVKLPIVVTYRLKYYTAWCSYDKKIARWRISYHPEKVIRCNYKQLLHIVAHEIGHTKVNGGGRKQREYKAELFALKTIKKYYPKYFTTSFTKTMIKNPVNERYYREPFKRALKDFKKWTKNAKLS